MSWDFSPSLDKNPGGCNRRCGCYGRCGRPPGNAELGRLGPSSLADLVRQCQVWYLYVLPFRVAHVPMHALPTHTRTPLNLTFLHTPPPTTTYYTHTHNAHPPTVIHWGVFSVPAFGSEWFQLYWQNGQHDDSEKNEYDAFVQATERPQFAYSEYAARFQAELYDAAQWADVLAQSGAQYVVLTSKHHEGYCMWDSRDVATTWQWNVMDVGPRRDLLGELAAAVRNVTSPVTQQPIQFGVYHSLYEWFNPLYTQDKAHNFTTTHFVDTKILPELYDLVHKYQPTLIWSDGQWEAHSDYWKAREFLDWYSTKSPVADQAVWNDRWGSDTMCHHGAFLTCSDRYHPDQALAKKWEKCLSIDKTSWGYSRKSNLHEYLTTQELVHELIVTVAQNGNLLLNLGPASGGNIPTIFQDRLHEMGTWLQVNRAAIYNTVAWSVCTNDGATPSVYYTQSTNQGANAILYAHLTEWPTSQTVDLACLVASTPLLIQMLGVPDTPLDWKVNPVQDTLQISLPTLTPDKIPCQHAWVLAIRTATTDDSAPHGGRNTADSLRSSRQN